MIKTGAFFTADSVIIGILSSWFRRSPSLCCLNHILLRSMAAKSGARRFNTHVVDNCMWHNAIGHCSCCRSHHSGALRLRSTMCKLRLAVGQYSCSRVFFLALSPGWYVRQKPLGEVRQVVSPPFPFPFPSPLPFHSLKFSDKPVGGKVRSSDGDVPRLPPLQILQISP